MEEPVYVFKPGDLVGWRCLIGGMHHISVLELSIMVEIVLQTRSKIYKVATVEQVPDSKLKNVGHTQWVTLSDLGGRLITLGDDPRFPGGFFRKCSE